MLSVCRCIEVFVQPFTSGTKTCSVQPSCTPFALPCAVVNFLKPTEDCLQSLFFHRVVAFLAMIRRRSGFSYLQVVKDFAMILALLLLHGDLAWNVEGTIVFRSAA
jgi:hypothetical protein